ncbi:MAG: helix-turn-helix transcriptional regulator [Bacteriovorax sp.]|nr:helix-turn-helix transcriptional regulator [Bacteriovorax sp.]
MPKEINQEKLIKKLGIKLREIRNSKGWTLEETENQGWPNWRHLQKIESGKNVTLATLIKISNLYSIKLSELVKSIE